MKKSDELSEPGSWFNKAFNDELLFILLARDEAAADTAEFWIKRRIELGRNEPGDPLLAEAAAHAAAMRAQQPEMRQRREAQRSQPQTDGLGASNHAIAGDQLDRLQDLTSDLIEILGRPSFACRELAWLLRESGQSILKRAEAEQAAVIHWMLNIYLQHGNEWRTQVKQRLQSMVDAVEKKEDTPPASPPPAEPEVPS